MQGNITLEVCVKLLEQSGINMHSFCIVCQLQDLFHFLCAYV